MFVKSILTNFAITDRVEAEKGFAMATMNVSLPDPMKNWVEEQSQTGKYSNSSDYVRDLIRRDQNRAEKIAHMQALVSEGLNSGDSTKTIEEILVEARKCSGKR